MTVTLDLTPELTAELADLARLRGLTTEQLLHEMIEQIVQKEHDERFREAMRATFAEHEELYRRLARG